MPGSRKEETWEVCEFDPSFSRRDYPTYEAYVARQKSKLATMDLDGHEVESRGRLRERLERLDFLRPGMGVLCLGARLGAEVQAFLDVGCSAVGVDLNPGEDNPLVVQGDFHDIQFASSSMDVVFTNSLDHAFDIRKVLGEIRRLLKPGGFLIVEARRGIEEGWRPDSWDCFTWTTVDALVGLLEGSGFELRERSALTFPWQGEQLCLEVQCEHGI